MLNSKLKSKLTIIDYWRIRTIADLTIIFTLTIIFLATILNFLSLNYGLIILPSKFAIVVTLAVLLFDVFVAVGLYIYYLRKKIP